MEATLLRFFRLGADFFKIADIQEVLFGDFVDFAVADFFEAL